MSGSGTAEARAALGRVWELAAQGRPESLAEAAAQLEAAAPVLARYVRELEPELTRLGRLAGQAAAFYAHCLAPASAPPVYDARGAAAPEAAGRVVAEG